MQKIKMFAAIPRRPDISVEEFHDHWRHPHGTFACGVRTMKKYVQSHRVPYDVLDSRQSMIEGVAETWMDNLADILALPSQPNYVRDVVPDEPLFIDLPNLRYVVTQEEVIYPGPDKEEMESSPGDADWDADERPTSTKVIQFIEEDNGKGRHWISDRDRDLGISIQALRHVRCSAVSIENVRSPFLGVRELWWPTQSAFRRGIAARPEAWADLIQRPTRSTTLLVQAERFR